MEYAELFKNAKVFENEKDDNEYSKWLDNNYEDGYVFKPEKDEEDGKYIIHKSDCHHIDCSHGRNPTQKFTTKDKSKVCYKDFNLLSKEFKELNLQFKFCIKPIWGH